MIKQKHHDVVLVKIGDRFCQILKLQEIKTIRRKSQSEPE